MKKDEALKLALEALEFYYDMHEEEADAKAITAIKKALAQDVLDRKAKNARELGLNYEPEVFSKQNYLNGYCVGQSDLLAEQAKQEPVAWEGGEGWESLAWELCADENGEDSCNELIWEGGPIPEPWGDRWMKYEEEAKRLIALVQKHTTPPQRTWVGLTDEEIAEVAVKTQDGISPRDDTLRFAIAIEAKLKEKNT